MNIFLAEDDQVLNQIITTNLEKLGYTITTFTDGEKAVDSISSDFDIYLIDINLPNINGFEIVRQLKLANVKSKIFVISADTDIETIIKAYDLGCDDYIKKPFDIRELVLKIGHSFSESTQIIRLCNGCTYDPVNRHIFYENSEVLLTNKEALLLDILVKNVGKTVSIEEIEYYVWGETIGNGYTRQLVSKLRKSLPCEIILNHASNGYRIEKYENC